MKVDFVVGDSILNWGGSGEIRILELLGVGGQGAVYRVSLGATQLALKWYSPPVRPAQVEAILALVRQGKPSDQFLWPVAAVRPESMSGFGYLMPLRPVDYVGIPELLLRCVEVDFYVLTTIAFALATAFGDLHSKGYCYRDISLNNVFLRPSDGAVLVCDNDNVGYDGVSECGVRGTPKFMAPEVVTGAARPSAATDRHSLAVLLFYIMMVAHPLDGAATESSIESASTIDLDYHYGEHPVFVFDPTDTSNRPVPGVHDNARIFWSIYPEALRRLFGKAFTVGLSDPDARIRESEWRYALSSARSSLINCPECGMQIFMEPDTGGVGVKPSCCWSCGQEAVPRVWIKSQIGLFGVRESAQLYPHHISAFRRYDFSCAVAEVVAHPSSHKRLGLRNLGDTSWPIHMPDGTTSEVPSGRAVDIVGGVSVEVAGHLVEFVSA